MTITFYNDVTKEHYGAFTAAGKNGQFLKAQKMQITSLRIKLLGKIKDNPELFDQITVMVVMDAASPAEIRKAFK